MVVWTVQGLAKRISGRCDDLLALGEEGSHNNCTGSTQLFAAEVGFGHGGLHGDSLLVAEGDGLQRPVGDYLGRQHDSTISAHLLAAHVQLCLVALVAAERFERGMLLQDRRKVVRLLGADVVVEEIGRHQRPDGGYGRCTAVWTVQVLAKDVALQTAGEEGNATIVLRPTTRRKSNCSTHLKQRGHCKKLTPMSAMELTTENPGITEVSVRLGARVDANIEKKNRAQNRQYREKQRETCKRYYNKNKTKKIR